MSNLLSNSKNASQYFSSLFVCLMEVAIVNRIFIFTYKSLDLWIQRLCKKISVFCYGTFFFKLYCYVSLMYYNLYKVIVGFNLSPLTITVELIIKAMGCIVIMKPLECWKHYVCVSGVALQKIDIL